LTVHLDLLAEEVDAVDGEPETLALAQPGAGGEQDQGAHARVHRRDQSLHRFDFERSHLARRLLRERDAIAGDAAIRRSPTAALKMVATQR
jgi:hypothetical protein